MHRPNVGLGEFHGQVQAADVRETDRITARIRRGGSSDPYQIIRVWRISPLGVELLPGDRAWSKGDRVDLVVVIDGNRTQFEGLVVERSEHSEGLSIIGIRFFVNELERKNRDDRESRRWICSEEHFPKAVAAAPGRYGSFIGIQIRNISKDGLQLYTNLSHAYLIPGMTLSMSVSLPTVGDTLLKAEIIRVRVANDGVREVLDVGARIIGLSHSARIMLGQYLVQFSSFDRVEQLIADGFSPYNVALGLTFRFLKSDAEYQAVLDLRLKSDGARSNPLDLISPLDRTSRIIIGSLGGQVVCSVRVAFPSHESLLSCEEYVDWTGDQSRRDQVVEITGISFVSGRFDNELILALMKYVCTSCISEQRSKVVVITDIRFKSLFEKIGWRELSSKSKNDRAVVLHADALMAIQGRKTNALWWNFVWGDVAQYLISAGTLRPKGLDKVMLRVFRTMNPVSKIFFSSKGLRRSIVSRWKIGA